VSPGGRTSRRRTSKRRERLLAVEELVARGLPGWLAARAIAAHPTTVRRWHRRQRYAQPLANKRGPRAALPTAESRVRAEQLVRTTHGLVGAASLSHSVPDLSRRAAAHVKRETCHQMELERRGAAERVEVTASGVIRGFDSMELSQRGRPRQHLLVACDGRVPYRTSWLVAPRYDERTVEAFLQHDLDVNGAPLVLRLDRAPQHTTRAITGMLRERAVIVLQGPAHYAPFYGQLERQNREHRGWMGHATLDENVERMTSVLNACWRRGTLGWLTAAEAWAMRPTLHVDRDALRAEVEDKSARLRRTLHLDGATRSDLAWRIAVRQALTSRGFLRVVKGGWC
jgi:hypothetical protein